MRVPGPFVCGHLESLVSDSFHSEFMNSVEDSIHNAEKDVKFYELEIEIF